MRTICLYFEIHQIIHLKRYRFFDIGTDHYYYDDYANETGMNEVAERSYIPALSTLIEMVKNSGGAFKVALSISGVALEQLEIHAPAVIDLLHQLNDTGCCEFLCEPYSHGLSSLANEDCFREEVLRQRDKMKQMFGKEPKVFRNSSLIYSDEIGGLVASMGFKGMLTEGAKHVLGWKSPHYVYHCNQAPSLKLLLRDFKLSDDIGFWNFIQYEFYTQWGKLKAYANSNGIEIIGDIPIYMGYDSVDVWANQAEFQLDENLTPVKVAGVPPDAFSDMGQKWGNPLYDWAKMENSDFGWWRMRMANSARLYDIIRIDHFLGIIKYYTIPYEMPDARRGSYEQGPGQKLLDAINESIGDKKIIAEDLGVCMPEVDQILKDNNYPGMKVLEFAFGGDRKNPHLPYNYTNNCVCYGGTHDNETLLGFFNDRNDSELGYAFDYLDTRDKYRMVDMVFRAAYSSVAVLTIFAVQDILKLDNSARMNFPSSFGNNWKWRMQKGQLNWDHLNAMRYLASVFDRERN